MLVGAFTSGLGDSINPCNFATILIFITILSYAAHTSKQLCLYGSLFIGLSGGIQYILVQGFLDPLLTSGIILEVIRYGYLLIAVAFLFLGGMHILDWKKYRKNNSTEYFKLQLPIFFQDRIKDQPLNVMQKVLQVVQNIGVFAFAAIILSFTGAVYPQSEYVFIVHSFLMAGQNDRLAYQSLGFYSFAMVLPLITVWLLIWFIALREKHKVKIISYYKGILASLFTATGIGLGYFFLN